MESDTRKNWRSRRSGAWQAAVTWQAKQRGRLGLSIHRLYTWANRYGVSYEGRKAVDSEADEMRRLKADEVRQDVFDAIAMFHNAKRRHRFRKDMSSVEHGRQYSCALVTAINVQARDRCRI